jgi:putative transcriptional regulator
MYYYEGSGKAVAKDRMRNRIRVLRAERDWTQERLADKLGVSRQSVNSVENGKHDPSLPLAFKIARLFGLKIEDVFLWEGEKLPAGSRGTGRNSIRRLQ